MQSRGLKLIIGIAALAVLMRLGATTQLDAWPQVKALLIPFAQVYLDIFNSPATAILLCLAMVFAATALFLYFWRRRLAPARRDLRITASRLHALTDTRPADLLPRLDEIMGASPNLTRGWTLYRRTLVRGPDGAYVSRVRPQAYFSMHALERDLRLRVYFGLPNDFVGIGLVFTFMGLVAGIYFASRSMMSTDLAESRQALVQLLHAATFKFMTSITGIGLSLLLSWSQRALLEDIQSELMEIQFLLEQALPASAAVAGTAAHAGALTPVTSGGTPVPASAA